MASELDPEALEILRGRLGEEGVPLVPSRVVRVYLCSTGSDSQTERNAFVDKVYPKLRQHCRNKYGVEFQMVDLEWGLPPDVSHVTPVSAEFRQGEIRRCQMLSAGPTFVAFVGQRYGDCPLQATILASEFETIRMALQHHRSRATRDAPLLDEWYVRDDNYTPPVYVLKPAAEIIEDLNSDDANTRSEAENLRELVTSKLRRLLQKGADYCYNEGNLDSDTRLRYYMSEQEIEMTMGMCDTDSPPHQCMLVTRNIIDLKNYIEDCRTPSFTEIFYNDKVEKLEFDSEAEQKLALLKVRAQNLVSSKNTLSYDVLWRYDDVINCRLHREYLDKLCEQVHDRLVELIDETVSRKRFDFPDVCEEPLLHLERCKQLGAEFYGRQDKLAQLRVYLEEDFASPLIIYGESGSGKTKLLSRTVHEIPFICGERVVTIIRYIGYTQMSSDVRQILQSICSQLCAVLDRDQADIPSDFKDIPKYFHDLLMTVPNYLTVAILLDGLEQILPDYNAHLLAWLPPTLPVNVKLIITCHPQSNRMLEILRTSVVLDDSFYMELERLSGEECQILMNEIMAASGKQLTQEQYAVYQQCFTKCSLPMFIHLLAEEAKTLHSFLAIENISRSSGILNAISLYFDKLEGHHGKVFVSRCMAFLAASGTGLSDCEMEDLLSLDDEVLNDVYSWYHPAIRRIPTIKWLELKRNIEPFLTSRNTDGATIYMWNHDLFLHLCEERYLADDEVRKEIHSLLADYYLGTWAENPKPVQAPDTRKDLIFLPCGDKADRKVPLQPLTFERNGSGVRFNKRKYDKVPRHLDLSGRTDELNKLVLFNYDWLYNKIKALSLQHIMTDFSLSPGIEASLVEGALRVAEPTLRKDINNLAPEITGRLLPYYATNPHIRELVSQCDTTGLKHCALVPNFPYMQVPGTSLQFTMECPVSSEYFGFLNEDRFLLAKERNSSYIYVFDLLTGELKTTIFASNGDFLVTPNGKYLVIVDHVTEKAIKFHQADTGSFLGQIIILNHIQMKPSETYKKGPMCLTDDRLCAIVTTEMSYLCIADVPSCKLLQIVALDGRSSVCNISPDGRYVFCSSNEFLLSYDLESLDLLCSISVGYKPNSLTFTQDGCRAFLSNTIEPKLYTLHLNFGTVDMSYKSIFDDELQDDTIMDLKVSPNDDLVLIRGKKTILVHDRATERVCAKLERPSDIPSEFRLPKSHYTELHFTKAEFSRDGVYVIGAIFRNVYVWEISTQSVVSTLQAPIGIITSMLVTKDRSQVVTQLQGQKAIQVWNIEDAVNKVDMLDRVVGPIKQMLVTKNSSTAYVQCCDSDAIGVVDLKGGTMLDLLTHDCDIKDMAITPNGNHLLLSVVPKMSNTSTRIWDMSERKVIKEFGNTPGYCICLNEKNGIIFVGQKEDSFRAPYYIKVMHFTEGCLVEEELSETVDYVLKKPFVTKNDGYLVVVTAKDYDKYTCVFDTPIICIFDLNKGMQSRSYVMQDLAGVSVDKIVDIRPHPVLDNRIAVIYTKGFSSDVNHNDIVSDYRIKSPEFSLIFVDVSNGLSDQTIEPFLDSSADVLRDAVYASDFTFCLDKESQMFSLRNGEYLGRIVNPPSAPKLLALEGSVAVYYRGSMIYAIRISDSVIIAQCEVHAQICYMKLCSDDRTLIIGCTDGTIASYVLIDPQIDKPKVILAKIGSRQIAEYLSSLEVTAEEVKVMETVPSRPSRSSRSSRSWDKVDQVSCRSYSRPPSVMSAGPRDKDLLRKIPRIVRERPKSDTQMYSKSAVCSVM